jgi:hypothetical protein
MSALFFLSTGRTDVRRRIAEMDRAAKEIGMKKNGNSHRT